ncbi:hypothetical protein NL676_036450 [Syzygium grande]|nr:hypothetical protein NL676_036450 [Syzygium grande]
MVDSLDNLQNKEKRIVGLLRTLGSFVADCWCNHRSAEASPIRCSSFVREARPRRLVSLGSVAVASRNSVPLGSVWIQRKGTAMQRGLDWTGALGTQLLVVGIRSKAYSS